MAKVATHLCQKACGNSPKEFANIGVYNGTLDGTALLENGLPKWLADCEQSNPKVVFHNKFFCQLFFVVICLFDTMNDARKETKKNAQMENLQKKRCV